MTAVAWSDSFATIDPTRWTNAGYGLLPEVLGGGKIRMYNDGSTCQLIHTPFGAEGSLAARSMAMAFTVYPAESSGDYYMAAGQYDGTWPFFQPHANTGGFTFLGLPDNVQYPGSTSMYTIWGDMAYPSAPFEVRVSTYIDIAASTILNQMVVDGILVVDEFLQSRSVSWDSYLNLGYRTPFLRQSQKMTSCVIGGLTGIYGGTPAENKAFVMGGTTPSTLSPVASVSSGHLVTLDTPGALPALYSRNVADIPTLVPYSTTPSDLGGLLYSDPFHAANGETIYVSTVIGNNFFPGGSYGYGVTSPVSITVTVPPPPPPPTIYPPTGSYTGSQMFGITSAPGTYIRFTTDGTDPTVYSEIWTRGLKMRDGMTVKAIALADGDIASEVASATYSLTGDKIQPIPSYTAHVLPYLLEQYKGDNP